MACVLSLSRQGGYSKRAGIINTCFSAVWLLAYLGDEVGTISVPLQPGCFPLPALKSLPPEYLLYQSFGAAVAGGNQHLMNEVVAPLGRYRGCPMRKSH